jgi:hypothetical protein
LTRSYIGAQSPQRLFSCAFLTLTVVEDVLSNASGVHPA